VILIQRGKIDILLTSIAIMVLYFIMGKLSFYFAFESSIVTITIFFPEGIALASVLLFGKKVIPGIFLGQFILALNMGLDSAPAFFIAMTNALEAMLALYVFQKLHFNKRLLTLKDIYLLFFLILFILQPFSALLGTLTLQIFSLIKDSFFHTMFIWWFGNSMGQLLLVPMLLIVYENRKKITIRDMTLTVILFSVSNYYLITVLEVDNIALLLSIMIPMIILVARYIGLHYAGIAVLVITISSLYMSRIGIGIFTTDTTLNNLININFYILAHIVIVYIHGVLIYEKESIVHDLAIFNEQLEEKIENEVNINREKERLLMRQSRMAQLGEMIAIITHQWRQPLNTLSIMTSRIYRQYTINRLTEDGMKKFYKNSQIQIQQMSEILDTFRNFFRPEKERNTYKVHEAISYILDILHPILEEESITVHVNVQKDMEIHGYQNEFAQVILNIINNAKDALSSIECNGHKQIWIEGQMEEGHIMITIEDNAEGIPAESLLHIFDPYFSTKTNLNGTGLGLYLSKVIIETHMGGSLTACNTERGAQFRILLYE